MSLRLPRTRAAGKTHFSKVVAVKADSDFDNSVAVHPFSHSEKHPEWEGLLETQIMGGGGGKNSEENVKNRGIVLLQLSDPC